MEVEVATMTRDRERDAMGGRMEWKRAEASDVGVNSAAGNSYFIISQSLGG
jgi:hypothetical protein